MKAQGTPVYHGTYENFDNFDIEKLGSNTGAPSSKEGFFFASNKKVSESYASDLNKKLTGLQKQSDEATKLLKELTGDSEITASQKFFHGEYPPEIKTRVDELLNKIRAYDDFVGGLEDVPMAYSSNLARSGKLKEIFLDIKNPLVYDMKGQGYRDKSYKDIILEAKKKGHDGVIIKNTYDGGNPVADLEPTDIYVAFDPSQIKTKSQLTDIWNKANKEIPKIETENFVPKVSQRISDESIEKGLIDEFGELPEIDKKTFKDEAMKIGQIIDQDPEALVRIALGQEDAAKYGISPSSAFTTVKKQALEKNNLDLLRQLATDEKAVPTQSSIWAQNMKLLDEQGAREDAFRKIKSIVDDREKIAKTKLKGEKPSKIKTDIKNKAKEKLNKSAPKIKDWNDFISSLKC